MTSALASKKQNIDPVADSLSEREQEILRLVVQSFIRTADPIGSRFLSRQSGIGLSAASIRNTMSDLEERGFLDHPYTSAGRVPTERGYRVFVDRLMESKKLSSVDKTALRKQLEELYGDTEKLLQESSVVLSSLTSLLGIVLTPKLSTGILERLEIVKLSSDRAMYIVSVRSGLVRTIVLQSRLEIEKEALDRVVALLNERLAGLTLEEIRTTAKDRVADLEEEVTGLVQMTLSEADSIFSEPPEPKRLQHGGAHHIIAQPEFQEPADLRGLIELIEDKNSVVKLIDGSVDAQSVRIVIGSEVADDFDSDKYSIVTAQYSLGQTVGTIGVIGPTRMDYARVVSVVEGMAAVLSNTNPKS
ncbi:MAG: heat-inducible transcription repressor HrcA [Rhodothermales bacterium]|nr:heat-inducible transcription repressor HrcA [Rhodothermales bacterium]